MGVHEDQEQIFDDAMDQKATVSREVYCNSITSPIKVLKRLLVRKWQRMGSAAMRLCGLI